ncbi:unnamed protein product [Blepharisma stoltei]|uniref:Aurora kinase n=1 Tax=Blepharisma stoltei TaxID=1481888 RepID=A0AAU9JGA1_9CILI|nr:unnamed protein product [Blepharisma stoltei]
MNKKNFTKLLFESPSVFNGEEKELQRSDFDFERKLGDGAFGQVWRIKHKATNKLYALKQVPKQNVAKMIPQFKRELLIMYELNHPHIIKLYNHFEDEKNFFLIMELAEGGNLYHRLYRERNFLEKVAAQYFREVLLAVEYLHMHVPAIIHRDIKPENILLDKDGRIKLTDFGWSNYYSTDTNAPRFTTCGTLEYLPPEMVQETGHSTAADIWCLGVLLYEMLTGTTPFRTPAKDQMLNNIVNAKVKFPLNFPPLAKELVTKMLEKNPADRITATETKNDRWLTEIPPIRETMVQEPVLKSLKSIMGPEVVTEGYKVINEEPPNENKEPIFSSEDNATITTAATESEAKEEAKEEEKEEPKYNTTPFKQNIKKLQKKISLKVEETIKTKASIRESLQGIATFNQKVKELEEKITEKRKELATLFSAEKEMLLKLSDINFELERIQSSNETAILLEKITNMQKDLMEKTAEVKVYKKNLENIRTDVKQKTMDINERDKNLSSLQLYLKKIKDEILQSKYNKRSELSELEINAEILKSQLEQKDRYYSDPSNGSYFSSKEMMDYVQKRLDELKCYKRDQLKKKIDEAHEFQLDKEQELAEMKIEYEDKKAEIIQNNRKIREEAIRKIKKRNEDSLSKRKNFKEEIRNKLIQKLNEFRNAESQYYIDPIEIDKHKKRLRRRTKRLERLYSEMSQIRTEREMMKEVLSLKKREVEDLEMEIGTAKIKLLGKQFF